VRLAVAGTTGIVEDEAYYWTWSERLAAGYYDHPPGVAFMIALSARLLGATSLGVRGGAVLFGAGVVALLLGAGRREGRFDPWLLLLLLGGLPLYTLGGVLATPDPALLLGWALAFAGAARGNWLVAGLGAGVAGLSKYTGWGIWPLFVLAAPREWRRMLPGMAVTALCLAPNLWWNAQHDWVSVRFQLTHGMGPATATTPRPPPGLGGLAEYVGAQAGLVSPILFGGIVAWWTQGWRGDRLDRLCWWTSAPVFVFFGLASMRTHGEPNWAAPAWLGASVGLARSTGRIARAAWVGGAFAAMLSAVVIVHLYHPLVEIEGDPTARLGVGRTLAQSVQAWGVEPVYTERYQEAAVIRFYEGLETYALPGAGRADQYDLWPVRWADGLFVRPARGGDATAVDPYCDERGPANLVTERNPDGSVFDRWQVYEVHGCHARE
jgi:4-amino-4-deoxy-L-arabinose transferase-like glycosyltransferase